MTEAHKILLQIYFNGLRGSISSFGIEKFISGISCPVRLLCFYHSLSLCVSHLIFFTSGLPILFVHYIFFLFLVFIFFAFLFVSTKFLKVTQWIVSGSMVNLHIFMTHLPNLTLSSFILTFDNLYFFMLNGMSLKCKLP